MQRQTVMKQRNDKKKKKRSSPETNKSVRLHRYFVARNVTFLQCDGGDVTIKMTEKKKESQWYRVCLDDIDNIDSCK